MTTTNMNDDTERMTMYNAASTLTVRQYAAIKLKVPNSGLEWMDQMIEQSRRDDLAGQAMLGLSVNMGRNGLGDAPSVSKQASIMVEAMKQLREAHDD